MIRKLIEAREGGAVERCHTLPHIGSYNNAQHQWGAAMLYLQLRGDTAQFKTVKAIMVHDLGERWVGDIPAPSKWSMSNKTALEISSMEDRCLCHLGVHEELDEDETKWLKAVDLLDLFLWANNQLNTGNRACQQLIDNIAAHLNRPEIQKEIPPAVMEVYTDYRWQRTSDLPPL